MRHTALFGAFAASALLTLPLAIGAATSVSLQSQAIGSNVDSGTGAQSGSAAAVSSAALTAAAGSTLNNPADVAAHARQLLSQVTALQNQLGGGVTSGGSDSSAGGNSCPDFTRVLKKGMSGDDVTQLQTFLARDPSIYPEGTVSGYFGSLTQAAVQRFQSAQATVPSGSPDTTGSGLVGPRTAAAIVQACGGGSVSYGGSSSGGSAAVQVPPGAVGGFIQVTPISGSAPLGVQVVATVNTTNSCTGATYTLTWGDNSTPIQIPVAAGNCSQATQTFSHIYQSGGAFPVTLSAGTHKSSYVITVYGSSGSIVPMASASDSFSGYPASGGAPLTVNFTGSVTSPNTGSCAGGCFDLLDYGDGTSAQVGLPASQGSVQSYSLSHAYAAGTYTATLYGGETANASKVGSVLITSVGSGSSGTITGSVPASYAPLTMTQSSGNPLSVTVQFDLTGCPAFSLDWGDGANEVASTGGCPSGTNTQTYSHTYASVGPFTLVLRRATQTNTSVIYLGSQ